jgi:hypothetical protein
VVYLKQRGATALFAVFSLFQVQHPETSSSNADVFGAFKLANLRVGKSLCQAQSFASLDTPTT